jgi:ABC-type Mn2+/Zn2+ transport system permease subunit
MAMALHINPVFGAVSMLFFGGLLVWSLEDKARVDTETLIGVLFSVALAAGSMMTSGEDLIEALFGGKSRLGWPEVVFGFASATAVTWFVISQRNRLVVALVSPDVARTAGIHVTRLNLLYLEMFSLTIALGLRYLGVLLMGALIIIPAATAKRLAKNLTSMLTIAVVAAVTSTLAGSILAQSLHRGTGPLIVVFSAACFLITFLFR